VIDLQSQEIKDISAALVKAQGSLENAKKDSTNPHLKSKFASLTSVLEAIREPLAKNGLSYTQATMPLDGQIFVVTTLSHVSGQWFRSYTPLILSKNDMQGLGSAYTYGRRYSLCAMVGITQEDDDGESIKTAAPSRAQEKFTPKAPQQKPSSDSCRNCGSVNIMPDKYKEGGVYCLDCGSKFMKSQA